MAGPVVLSALKHVSKTLDTLNVPSAVMGGIALATWEHLRATYDVDLLVGVDEADVDRVVAGLKASGIHPMRDPPVLDIGRMRLIQCRYEPPESFVDVQIDLLLAECPYQRESLARRTLRQVPELDTPVAVLACEDLVLYKLIAGRVLDRADAAYLLRANRHSLDLSYLTKWATELEVQAEFNEAWEAALPGEPSPLTTP